MINKAKKITIFVAVPLLLTGCVNKEETPTSVPEPQIVVQATAPENYTQPKEKPIQLWTDEELELIALTLAGECYNDKTQDKRLVCEVILNRVSDGRFGDSVTKVITAPNQFKGYWTQSRPVSDSDYEVTAEALEDWYANDCEALSEYLFFVAGDNRENVFRSEY